jgi:hypothetical protein
LDRRSRLRLHLGRFAAARFTAFGTAPRRSDVGGSRETIPGDEGQEGQHGHVAHEPDTPVHHGLLLEKRHFSQRAIQSCWVFGPPSMRPP